MSKDKAQKRKEYDYQTRDEVVDRDKARCVLCHAPAHDLHEIVPRSAFGYDKSDLLFDPKNRVCLCRDHHSLAHNFEMRRKLLTMLQNKYQYVYEESEFRRYLDYDS